MVMPLLSRFCGLVSSMGVCKRVSMKEKKREIVLKKNCEEDGKEQYKLAVRTFGKSRVGFFLIPLIHKIPLHFWKWIGPF